MYIHICIYIYIGISELFLLPRLIMLASVAKCVMIWKYECNLFVYEKVLTFISVDVREFCNGCLYSNRIFRNFDTSVIRVQPWESIDFLIIAKMFTLFVLDVCSNRNDIGLKKCNRWKVPWQKPPGEKLV